MLYFRLWTKNEKENAMENWYAVKTKTGFGEQDRAEENLLCQMIKTFNPKKKVEKMKRGKVTVVTEPVFRNYLFVKFDPAVTSAGKINNSFGVSKLLTFGDVLVKVDAKIIEGLMALHKKERPVDTIRPGKGEKVEISKGLFAGLEAIYKEKSGENRSMLLINMLGGTQAVAVENADFL